MMGTRDYLTPPAVLTVNAASEALTARISDAVSCIAFTNQDSDHTASMLRLVFPTATLHVSPQLHRHRLLLPVRSASAAAAAPVLVTAARVAPSIASRIALLLSRSARRPADSCPSAVGGWWNGCILSPCDCLSSNSMRLLAASCAVNAGSAYMFGGSSSNRRLVALHCCSPPSSALSQVSGTPKLRGKASTALQPPFLRSRQNSLQLSAGGNTCKHNHVGRLTATTVFIACVPCFSAANLGGDWGNRRNWREFLYVRWRHRL